MTPEASRLAPPTIRPYAADDAEPTLRIFERAIRVTALSRYTAEQTAAWLGGPRDLKQWATGRQSMHTFVAEIDGVVAGFTDLSDAGYVDRLFVDPDFGRRGVGAALLEHVVDEADQRGIRSLSTHASLVAEPVFAAAGFTVSYRETVEKDGQRLDRAFMVRESGSRQG